MTSQTVSRWARRYVLTSAGFLVAWQAGTLAGLARTPAVLLGVLGFVLHMVFGKAYSLVPSYFDRELAFDRAPAVQYPLVVVGAVGLAAGWAPGAPSWLRPVAAVAWSLGVAVFVGTLGWTIRTNLTGGETATGETKADRRPVDRLANGFVPVALAYLAVGTYDLLAVSAGLPPFLVGSVPGVAHLLAAGTAALLVFALGFRLLPRFLVASPPRPLVGVVLATGALGPLVLATNLGAGPLFHLGAALEATAVGGFAVGYAVLFSRSTRRRVGVYGVLVGSGCGVLGVSLGLWFALGHLTSPLVSAHLRLNLLGFLGLTIVGIAYQFYPPAIGRLPGASDRTALLAIGAVAAGLLVQFAGLAGGLSWATALGGGSTLVGACLYLYTLAAVFRER